MIQAQYKETVGVLKQSKTNSSILSIIFTVAKSSQLVTTVSIDSFVFIGVKVKLGFKLSLSNSKTQKYLVSVTYHYFHSSYIRNRTEGMPNIFTAAILLLYYHHFFRV